MRNVDPLWSSSQVCEHVTKCRPGALVRIGRCRLGWRQGEPGRRIGCSASTRWPRCPHPLPSRLRCSPAWQERGHCSTPGGTRSFCGGCRACSATPISRHEPGPSWATDSCPRATASAAQVLIKIESYDRARIAADRATLYADLSGSALVAAAAAREMAIVLRHQGQESAARRMVSDAAEPLDAAGLTTDAQRSAHAQMLCTTAYTAAQAGGREQALAMIREAAAAAHGLPDVAPKGRLFAVTPAAVDAYAVSVHWALGDSGAALAIGGRLLPQQFATAERRGRFHTDMARAWWQWGRPEQTATALLQAARIAPAEVRDRPAIRRIVTDLGARHPLTPGVRALTTALATTPRTAV